MQVQKQKTVPQQRLSIGEVIVGALSLLLCLLASYLASFPTLAWVHLLLRITMGSAAVSLALSGSFIFMRQRRIALYCLCVAAFAFTLPVLAFLWITISEGIGWSLLLKQGSLFLLVALLLAWFARLLKGLEDAGE